MGLLDDAIREHLDLKRARGGDPTEIERMEREALGPVRREPTIGSARVEAVDERSALALEPDFHDDHLADLEELQEHGYHDSTAPHAHPHREHLEAHDDADDHFGLAHDPGAPFIEEAEQPRRRFLRRNRPAPDSVRPEPAFHEDEPAFDPLDPLGHHDPLAHVEPLAHHEPLGHGEPAFHHEPPFEAQASVEHDEPLHQERVAHEEPVEHDELAEHDEPVEHPTAQDQASPLAPPPHLQFDHPPKRPRFSAEPPELHDGPAAPGAVESAAPLPSGEPDESTEVEPQETTEFDVQKHIAETRHQPDEAPSPSAPSPSAPKQPEADDDVLEETPEFLQDTPEHDRLWFEQRPPKDFDFDG